MAFGEPRLGHKGPPWMPAGSYFSASMQLITRRASLENYFLVDSVMSAGALNSLHRSAVALLRRCLSHTEIC